MSDEKTPKLKGTALEETVLNQLLKSSKSIPGLDNKYYIKESENGERELLRDDGNKILSFVNETKLRSDIYLWNIKQPEAIHCPYSKLVQITKRIVLHLPIINGEIQAVRLEDDKGFCYHRVDFEAVEGDCPLFHELLNRTSHGDALAAFIGSLFHMESDRQQYLWLYGDGQNGKSTILRFLSKLMGNSATSESPPDSNNMRFWSSCVLGKRLVALPDCDNSYFTTSGLFKALTGGDGVKIEPKGRQPYSITHDAKFVFCSNQILQLTRSKSDMRRAIFISIEPILGEMDPTYEDKLWNERGAVLHYCLEKYRTMVDQNGEIPYDPGKLSDAMNSTYDDMVDGFFDRYFVAEPGAKLESWVYREKLAEYGIKSNKDMNSVFLSMQRKYGIYKKREADEGTVRKITYYVGVRIKNHEEFQENAEKNISNVTTKKHLTTVPPMTNKD